VACNDNPKIVRDCAPRARLRLSGGVCRVRVANLPCLLARNKTLSGCGSGLFVRTGSFTKWSAWNQVRELFLTRRTIPIPPWCRCAFAMIVAVEVEKRSHTARFPLAQNREYARIFRECAECFGISSCMRGGLYFVGKSRIIVHNSVQSCNCSE